MADFKIDGRMKVKKLKEEFKKAFGATLRVYNGTHFADDDASLASIRKDGAKGGEFSPTYGMSCGGFEKRMNEMFGIKVQVANADDSNLAKDATVLGKAKND